MIKVTIHTVREFSEQDFHLYAKHLIRAGVPEPVVRQFAGTGSAEWKSDDPGGPVVSTYVWTRES